MTASKIEWCDRSDWNPIRGCTRVSPGCGGPGPHGGCYAEAIAARFSDPGQPFHGYAERTASGPRWTGKVGLIEERLDLPLRWRKPARIFVNSTYDLFHEAIPDEWIDQVFAVMALAPQHTFQVLTKRAERMRGYLSAKRRMGDADICRAINRIPASLGDRHGALELPLPNVWLGVSVEDQARADERIPLLLKTPAEVKFISAEPLLSDIEILDWLAGPGFAGIDWVIAGGESGPGARPMHPDWARSLRDQCQAAGVPFFFKQWGEWGPLDHSAAADEAGWQGRGDWMILSADGDMNIPDHRWPDEEAGETTILRVGKKAAGRLLDGREWSEFPA